jgi:hypothetical protein
MKPVAVRYRLHVDVPVTFSCHGVAWRFEQVPVFATNSLRCDAVGTHRYTVTAAADEASLRAQLRSGIEVRFNSYLCTLFMRLEQLGLAERVPLKELRRAS